MADGTTLRADVSVEDGAVEVTLHGSQEMGAMAVSDAQQLRDGLSEQGLDLAEFEFQAEAEGDEDAEAQGETASEHAGPVDFAPADFDPDDEDNLSALALAAKDPELSRGAFVRRRM
jgi:DNA-binding protein YbaB